MTDAPPRWLPRLGTPAFHAYLIIPSLLLLAPLVGATAAYMNFSLGFIVPGQVLAGILGSVLTYRYGPAGKQGANYVQTLAGPAANMAAMAVIIQAMAWLGMPALESWKFVAFMICVGMFAVGVGMFYTPLLVDRLQLEYPSGHAVANILRALTDRALLRRSIGKLGGGTLLGTVLAAFVEWVPFVGATRVSGSTIGAGMVIGSRNTVSAALVGAVGVALVPTLRAHGWLGAHDPFRKLGFLAALAMILGAAVVDMTLVGADTVRRMRARRASRAVAGASEPSPESGVAEDPRGGRMSMATLSLWCAGWAAALVVVAHTLLGQPVGWMLFAIALSVVFVCINGISTGITDSNPISSAFVVSVLLLSALGLHDPFVALVCSSVLLMSTSTGVDMQQDRSTGWRLGTNRMMQFRYQLIGVGAGAVLCVVFARLFMRAYPVLAIDSFAHPEAQSGQWQSAMTFKLVGAIRDIGHLPRYKLVALAIGFALGFGIEIARKVLLHRAPEPATAGPPPSTARRFRRWLLEALILPSPYASAFGGFVDLPTSLWFAAGGLVPEFLLGLDRRRAKARGRTGATSGSAPAALPEDMSTGSLVGGGLIAGESLFALALGLWGLARLL